MTFKEIKELISLVSDSAIKEFRYKSGEIEIKIRTDKDTDAPIVSSHPMTHAVQPAAVLAPPVMPAAGAPKEVLGAVSESAPTNSKLIEIKSPMVGTFYRAASPEKPPYVQVGDVISKGSVVCVIEAMKLFNEIESEVSGKVVKVLTDDASPVEYDQVLFLIEPNS